MVDQRAPQPRVENRTQGRPGVPLRGLPLCYVHQRWQERRAVHACRCWPSFPLSPPLSARQPPAWPVKGPETSTTGTALGLGKVWVGPLPATRVVVENRDFLHWASEQEPTALPGALSVVPTQHFGCLPSPHTRPHPLHRPGFPGFFCWASHSLPSSVHDYETTITHKVHVACVQWRRWSFLGARVPEVRKTGARGLGASGGLFDPGSSKGSRWRLGAWPGGVFCGAWS